MRTGNCSVNEDRILSACKEFGGLAADAVEICAELDDKLSGALTRIEELEAELKEAQNHE